MSSFPSAILSIAVLAAFVLAGGGVYLIHKRINRLQGVLMLVMAVVLIVNVMLLTV